MAITYLKELHKIEVYPELNGNTNVVRRVTWYLRFYDDEILPEVRTEGLVESILPDPDPENDFLDISQLTKEQILDWAFQQEGGDIFVETIRPIHESQLSYLWAVANTQEYDLSLIPDA